MCFPLECIWPDFDISAQEGRRLFLIHSTPRAIKKGPKTINKLRKKISNVIEDESMTSAESRNNNQDFKELEDVIPILNKFLNKDVLDDWVKSESQNLEIASIAPVVKIKRSKRMDEPSRNNFFRIHLLCNLLFNS